MVIRSWRLYDHVVTENMIVSVIDQFKALAHINHQGPTTVISESTMQTLRQFQATTVANDVTVPDGFE